MLISRTAEVTDEDDILEILQHSGGPCGPPKNLSALKNIFTSDTDAHFETGLNTIKLFPLVHAPAGLRSSGWAASDAVVANASAVATAWRQRPPQWPLSKAPATHTRPSSAFAARIPELLAADRGKSS